MGWRFINSSPTSAARPTWWPRRGWEPRPPPKARNKPQQDVLLAVNRAYYGVLRAEAVLKVAEETVKARQILTDQVTTLEKNKLKSMLDVSFAEVNLAQARLLLVQAQNDQKAADAELATALGLANPQPFDLAEEPMPAAPPADPTDLIAQALQNRPIFPARASLTRRRCAMRGPSAICGCPPSAPQAPQALPRLIKLRSPTATRRQASM